jgi:hypothetical protein
MYLQRGVLPRPRFLGSATRYQRRQLVGLLAIRRLRTAEKLSLTAIRTRLQKLTDPELEAFATEAPLAGPIASALSLPSAGTPTALSKLPEAFPTLTADGVRPARWARIELALGLEVHLRDDASPEVHDLARRVREICAAGSMPET